MEGTVKGDEAVALGRSLPRLIAPRHLDRAFNRLGARIGEEHIVSEARLAKPRRKPLLARDAVQVRDVPELLRLLAQRLDQVGVGVAKRGHGDARGEVEKALAFRGEEIGAFPALEGKTAAGIGRQER